MTRRIIKQELLNTIQIYCSYFYGTMLWRWGGGQVLQVLEQLCQVVLGIIQEYTCVFGWQSSHMRGSIYSTASITRYVKFNRSLRSSPSKEVAVVARIVGSDAGGHILSKTIETQLKPRTIPMSMFCEVLHNLMDITGANRWRINIRLAEQNCSSESLSNWPISTHWVKAFA